MQAPFSEQEALRIWHDALVESVRRDGPDLSARQMAVLMQIYIEDGPHTVRGLSTALNISKPAISRALDRLVDLGYLRRDKDPQDRRNVLVRRTVRGAVYLSDFAGLIVGASGK